MIIETIVTIILIGLVLSVLWLARRHNIHIDYDATGLEAHPKEALNKKNSNKNAK